MNALPWIIPKVNISIQPNIVCANVVAKIILIPASANIIMKTHHSTAFPGFKTLNQWYPGTHDFIRPPRITNIFYFHGNPLKHTQIILFYQVFFFMCY